MTVGVMPVMTSDSTSRTCTTWLRCLGDFPALAHRLDDEQRLGVWAQRHPHLEQIGSIQQLLSWRDQQDPATCNAALAALVWWASTEGGNDEQAVLVVLHLLAPGVSKLTHLLRSLCGPDTEALVIGELTAQILAFPWQRRTHAVAANLLLDTRAGLLREWLPSRRAGQPRLREVPCDPNGRLLAQARQQECGKEEPTLTQMIHWARRCGLIDGEEAKVLVALADQPRSTSPVLSRAQRAEQRPELRVAAVNGVSVRTIERRKARALSALRNSRSHFLAQAA